MVTKRSDYAITRDVSAQQSPTSELNAHSKTILLVGGSVRAAAVDAHRAGFSIVALDHFGDADLRAVCQQWIHLQRTDAWMDATPQCNATIVPTGGFDWPTAGPPSHQGLIAFPSKPQFDAMRDPRVLAELASDAGIGFPITFQHDELANVNPATHHDWMIKPHAGTGGLGIRSLCHINTEPMRPGEYLQERVSGRPVGVNFISRFGDAAYQTKLLAAFAGLTHRKNPEHRWLYGGSIGPLGLQDTIPIHIHQQLCALGDRIAERFELVGLFNVDFILTPDRSLVLLEINPRYSASMELMPTAGHLVDCHIAAYEENLGHIDRQQADHRFAALDQHAAGPHRLACKRIVYATQPTRFNSSVEDLCKITRDLSEPDGIQVTYHDIPSTNDIIPSGYPVLTIIARYQGEASSVSAQRLIRQTHRIAARIRYCGRCVSIA
ncbi:MAG TPA: hypothetical protein DDZ51_07620 [Planctomycetaceae bacterium]|nr:hypothetical protein [Planctomycetaceae bacterium]